MPSDSNRERPSEPDDRPLHWRFDEHRLVARPGDSVAAALVAAGHVVLRRTPVSGAPRGPFCMMGACFDCLVEIDGVPNRQACMTAVSEGMVVRSMAGPRSLG